MSTMQTTDRGRGRIFSQKRGKAMTDTAGTKRRRTRHQLVSNALRQAKRLGEGDQAIGWVVGMEIGKSLANAVLLRKLTGDERNGIGFWLSDLMTDLANLQIGARTEEESIRLALFCAVCREYDEIVRWAYEQKVFQFNFNDEGEVMREATKRAARVAAKTKQAEAKP